MAVTPDTLTSGEELSVWDYLRERLARGTQRCRVPGDAEQTRRHLILEGIIT